jgi:hypothetical protein
MSRTYRRNHKWLIQLCVGNATDIDNWNLKRYQTNDVIECHRKKVKWFISERRQGQGSKQDFRRLHYNKPDRCFNKREIHNNVQSGDWDNHRTRLGRRGATNYWIWIHH